MTEADADTRPAAKAAGHVVTVPKALEAAAANQDAAAFDDRVGRYAVSDGVSRSTRAALFSRALVEEVVRAGLPAPSELPSWLRRPQEAWAEGNEERRKQAKTWYAKTPGYGAATLAAASVAADGVSVELFAVGDSCILHARGGELVALFPALKLADFGFAPPSLSTDPAREPPEAGTWKVTAMPGDALLLVTDALAKWILAALERGETAVLRRMLSFRRAEGQRDFEQFVAQERAAGRLDDDDTTLLTVVLPEASAPATVTPVTPSPPLTPTPVPERRPSGRPPRPLGTVRPPGPRGRRAQSSLALGCAAFFLGGLVLVWCAVRVSTEDPPVAGAVSAASPSAAGAPSAPSSSAQSNRAPDASGAAPHEPLDAGRANPNRSTKPTIDGGRP